MAEDSSTSGNIGQELIKRIVSWIFDFIENTLPEELIVTINNIKTKIALHASGEVRKKQNRERKILFEEELGGSGYPIDSLNNKSIEALLNSFSLSSLGPAIDIVSNTDLTVMEFINEVVDKNVTFHVVSGESGSGKTVFALTLALQSLSIRKDCYSFYLRPIDFDSPNNESKAGVKKWARVLKKDTLIIILDALNETIWRFDTIQSFVKQVQEIKSTNLKFVILYRRLGSGALRSFVLRLSRMFGEDSPNSWSLPFHINENKHCLTVPLLLNDSQLQAVNPTVLLKRYEDQFLGFKSTRGTAFELYKYYQRMNLDPRGSLPKITPWSLVFSNIIGEIPPNKTLLALCKLCFNLLETGRFTDWIAGEYAEPSFQEYGLNFQQSISQFSGVNKQGNYGLRLKSLGNKFRFPDEMHIHALAGLWIADVIKQNQQPLVKLIALKGRSSFDNSARFVLPACELLAGDPNKVLGFIEKLGNSQQAPYSFCAQFLNTEHGQLLKATQSDLLKSELFGNLITALDLDRTKTCVESIKCDMPNGPNPLVDQLFEVTNIYSDDAVEILINSVLLDEKNRSSTARSQGAYMLLNWLEKTRGRDYAISSNKYIYLEKITNGIKKLSTWNLHIRFHILEVLEFLFEEKRRAGNNTTMNWADSLEELAQNFSKINYKTWRAKLDNNYIELNKVISDLVEQLVNSQKIDTLAISEKIFEIIKIEFASGQEFMPGTDNDLELYLECVEVTLGLARRNYCDQHSQTLESHIINTENSELWIIRWWGFYNLLVLVSRTNNPEHNHIVWLIKQLFRKDEPIGLKKRQCTHLLSVLPTIDLKTRSLFREKFQQLFREEIKDTQVPGSAFRDLFTKPYREKWEGDPHIYLAEYFQGLETIFDFLELADLSNGLVDRNISALV